MNRHSVFHNHLLVFCRNCVHDLLEGAVQHLAYVVSGLAGLNGDHVNEVGLVNRPFGTTLLVVAVAAGTAADEKKARASD